MKKYITLILGVAVLLGAGFYAGKFKKASVAPTPIQSPSPVSVITRSVADSRAIKNVNSYPGIVTAAQSVDVVAETSGNATSVNFALGDKVLTGQILVRIDDAGSSLGKSDQGFRNAQIKQAELAVQQAEEGYDLAKSNYKNSSDLSSSQRKPLKSQKDIAELQLESAKLALSRLLDMHSVKAPFGGAIVAKNISVGEAVNQGQVLATISNPSDARVTFYIDQSELKSVRRGGDVSVIISGGKIVTGTITSVGAEADPQTKRFLVEARVAKNDAPLLVLGSIVTIEVEIATAINNNGSEGFLVPLSALTVGQNETSIFMVESDVARQVPVTVVEVMGETARITANISADTQVVIEGNKLIQEGSVVTTVQ